MKRWIRWLAALGMILAFGGSSHGQGGAGRRWLADPELLLPSGWGGSVLTMEMVDATTGWASTGDTLLRFDGRRWRVDQTLTREGDSRDGIWALSFADREHGWAGGAIWFRTTPTLKFGAYDGARWSWTTEFRGKNGRLTAATGQIYDIAALPGGQALALGSVLDHSMVFKYDGAEWSDITPDGWGEGRILTNLSMVSPSEGWAGGYENDRALMLHFKDGVWSKADLPDLGNANRLVETVMNGPDEGWAVVNTYLKGLGLGTMCTGSAFLRFRDGAWTTVESEQPIGRPIRAFALIPGTDQGWATLAACNGGKSSQSAERRRFDAGRLLPDPQGATLGPDAYGLLDADHQYAAVGGYFLRWSDERLATERIEPSQAPGARFFPASGHSLGGAFLDYYAGHGLDLGDDGVSERESLALFGYPISEPFDEINPDTGATLTVQYFERARMELHPENAPPYDVLLGRLTVSALRRRNISPAPPPGPVPAECARSEATRFDLCPPLRGYWERNGATPVFGHPLSQAWPETSQTDGQVYATQYFERGRMEHHPEHQGTQYEVLLGLLGSEELQARGYLTR
ncbi:MAG TPA: hypothetical protein VD886_21680 [Herpetosiphonaceae bacterium]|nr:hypothetical protein [Herpetosiphonaceae bacterium]